MNRISIELVTTKTKIKEAEKIEKYIVPFMWIASITDVLMLIISFREVPGPNRNCPAAWL